MKTRNSPSNENACHVRKPKKCGWKDRPQPKEHAETKKARPPVQQNRFTNILELSTLSASLMQLHDLLGTLVLDFAEDPVQVKISDVTGNYELNVSKESLSEFKMKVLLGQNSKGKPAFTIFLGECQCYPELPEGALEWSENQNNNTVSQIDSIGNDSKTEVKDDDGDLAKQVSQEDLPTADPEEEAQTCDTESDDIAAPLLSLFEGLKVENARSMAKKDLVTYETHHISVRGCSPKLTPLSVSDELIVKVKPKRISTKMKKTRSQKKPETTAARRASKKRSTYRNNLEGFVKFLMTDKVCGSLLDKMKAPENVVHLAKRMSGQKVVNYSDGKEYRVLFSREKEKKGDVKTEVYSQSSDCRETDHGHDDVDSTGGGGIQVLFERPKPFEKSAFVKQVKKELEEWQARGEQTVNVELVEDAKSSSSAEETDSNVVTVYEDPKTSKKLDTEYDDATSHCISDTVESTERFFVDLKENEKRIEEKPVAHADEKEDTTVLDEVQFDRTHAVGNSEEYVTPIPLETTSTADIETLWMNFVEMFHRSSEVVKKLSLSSMPIQEAVEHSAPKVSPRLNDKESSDGTYPGQHYLPYFVEESLKKANSMLAHNPPPDDVHKRDAICPPQTSKNLRGDLPPEKNEIFPSKLSFHSTLIDAQPISPPFHRHPILPEKFSTKKSRIFFNPHVSIGDWYCGNGFATSKLHC